MEEIKRRAERVPGRRRRGARRQDGKEEKRRRRVSRVRRARGAEHPRDADGGGDLGERRRDRLLVDAVGQGVALGGGSGGAGPMGRARRRRPASSGNLARTRAARFFRGAAFVRAHVQARDVRRRRAAGERRHRHRRLGKTKHTPKHTRVREKTYSLVVRPRVGALAEPRARVPFPGVRVVSRRTHERPRARAFVLRAGLSFRERMQEFRIQLRTQRREGGRRRVTRESHSRAHDPRVFVPRRAGR